MTNLLTQAQQHLDAAPPADALTLAADVRALLVEVIRYRDAAERNMTRGTRNAKANAELRREVERLTVGLDECNTVITALSAGAEAAEREVERLTVENQRLRHQDDTTTPAMMAARVDAFAAFAAARVKRVSPEVEP